MAEVNFLFDNQLISELENLIKNSKHQLLLISPFIDLDKRIEEALREKISKHDFELKVLFGKNEDNIYKSIKKNSLNFFKQFPNIQIRYNDRLHAKFYQNDFDYIMTSLNLYDYSLAKNIEVGIFGSYASKGLIGKVGDSATSLIDQGIEKVKQNVFGMGKEVDPIEKFQTIFENSELKYQTEPIIIDKDGLKGMFGAKKLNGFNVIVDNFSESNKDINTFKRETFPINENNYKKQFENSYSPNFGTTTNINVKYFSGSQLSKSLGFSLTEFTNVMQKAGLINGDQITAKGLTKGLVLKKYMGNDYIAYPENLEELKLL